MKPTLVIVSIGVAGLTIACRPAVSIRALVEQDDCIDEPRVEGEWMSPASEDGEYGTLQWSVVRGANRYEVVIRSTPDEGAGEPVSTRYRVCLVNLEGTLFFDAEVAGRSTPGMTDRLPVGAVPLHVPGRLRVEDDFLVVQLLDSRWVEENTSAAFHAALSSGVALITGPPSELRSMLKQHADHAAAIGLTLYLCRPDADCLTRGYEHGVSHLPADFTDEDTLALLGAAAEHHLKMGHYRRAAELRRQACALTPGDPFLRHELGVALLLNREYAAAREEFARVQAMEPADSRGSSGIGWSYFLEGRFDEAAQAVSAVVAAPDVGSIEPVLLAHVALLRSGQREAAEELLARHLATFHGPAEQQLLLLLYARRIDESPASMFETAEERSRVHFFTAEFFLGDGNPDAAAGHLWECVTRGGKDSLYVAAAVIELERMSDYRQP